MLLWQENVTLTRKCYFDKKTYHTMRKCNDIKENVTRKENVPR